MTTSVLNILNNQTAAPQLELDITDMPAYQAEYILIVDYLLEIREFEESPAFDYDDDKKRSIANEMLASVASFFERHACYKSAISFYEKYLRWLTHLTNETASDLFRKLYVYHALATCYKKIDDHGGVYLYFCAALARFPHAKLTQDDAEIINTNLITFGSDFLTGEMGDNKNTLKNLQKLYSMTKLPNNAPDNKKIIIIQALCSQEIKKGNYLEVVNYFCEISKIKNYVTVYPHILVEIARPLLKTLFFKRKFTEFDRVGEELTKIMGEDFFAKFPTLFAEVRVDIALMGNSINLWKPHNTDLVLRQAKDFLEKIVDNVFDQLELDNHLRLLISTDPIFSESRRKTLSKIYQIILKHQEPEVKNLELDEFEAIILRGLSNILVNLGRSSELTEIIQPYKMRGGLHSALQEVVDDIESAHVNIPTNAFSNAELITSLTNIYTPTNQSNHLVEEPSKYTMEPKLD